MLFKLCVVLKIELKGRFWKDLEGFGRKKNQLESIGRKIDGEKGKNFIIRKVLGKYLESIWKLSLKQNHHYGYF